MPITKKTSISFALIHNNNEERNNYLLPHLEGLIKSVSSRFNVKRFYISAQPIVVAHSTWMTIFRNLFYEKLDRNWCRYLNVKPRFLLITIINFIRLNVKKHLLIKTSRDALNRNSFIETIVTDKHIRAWNAFMETDCEYLVCFEDDAIFQDSSAERLLALFDTIMKKEDSQFVYVDLAGGCDIKDLQISQLETIKQEGFMHYSKPITNTACVYMLSRALVSEFLNQLTRRPWLRLIGIDWMMNKLFINIEKHNLEILCMHSAPPIFHHGSTVGVYNDWRK